MSSLHYPLQYVALLIQTTHATYATHTQHTRNTHATHTQHTHLHSKIAAECERHYAGTQLEGYTDTLFVLRVLRVLRVLGEMG